MMTSTKIVALGFAALILAIMFAERGHRQFKHWEKGGYGERAGYFTLAERNNRLSVALLLIGVALLIWGSPI